MVFLSPKQAYKLRAALRPVTVAEERDWLFALRSPLWLCPFLYFSDSYLYCGSLWELHSGGLCELYSSDLSMCSGLCKSFSSVFRWCFSWDCDCSSSCCFLSFLRRR